MEVVMIDLRPVFQSVERSFLAYEVMIVWISGVKENELRTTSINSLKRQLRMMGQELDHLEAACLAELAREHEDIFNSLWLIAKTLRSHHPTFDGCGYSLKDMDVERINCAKKQVAAEDEVLTYFNKARHKLFSLSVTTRAL
jgi:hypothetical protein